MAVKKKGADFEQSLNALETLVNKMEQGDMTLEESLKAFETGIQLTRECQARLTAAEQQVQKLVENQAVFEFTQMNYNAVFIVEQQNVSQMQECLFTKNYFACPSKFSFGRFR